MADEFEWEVAKIRKVDVGFEDHGIFVLFATFDYGGSGQGLGYCVDQEFIECFIKACGVSTLNKCNNRIVMILHNNCTVVGIKPLPFEEGEEFDIQAWLKRKGEKWNAITRDN